MEQSVPLTYYDRVLVGIAASLGGGALIGLLAGVGLQVGLLFGALVATVILYDALFRNPPVPEGSPSIRSIAVVWHLFLGGLVLWLLA